MASLATSYHLAGDPQLPNASHLGSAVSGPVGWGRRALLAVDFKQDPQPVSLACAAQLT